MNCLHCSSPYQIKKGRGLCRRCHARPEIRAKYATLVAHREDHMHDPPLPPEPTQAQPQSAEIVEVMRERDSNGFHIKHPEDRGQRSGVRGQEDDSRIPPMWRAIMPTGHVYGGIFAADKSQARAELKRRLRVPTLPAGTKLEQVRNQGSGVRSQESEVHGQAAGD